MTTNNVNDNVLSSSTNASEVTAETKDVKVVKKLIFKAFMEGLEKNDYRPWSSSSTVDNVKLDRALIPPLAKHMYELSKLLGEVVPLNVKDKSLPKGVDILNGDDNLTVYAGEMLLSVVVELNFTWYSETLTSEDLAYAVKDLGKNITPDEQLVALAICVGEDGKLSPIEGSNVFKGTVTEDMWFPYIRNGERRNMFNVETDENGNTIFKDSGIQFFPQKSAWKFLDDKKRIIGNNKMLDYIKSYHEKSKQIKEYEAKREEYMIASKGGYRNKFVNKKRDYDKQPPTKSEVAIKDNLGNLGDNFKPANNKAKAWLKNYQSLLK